MDASLIGGVIHRLGLIDSAFSNRFAVMAQRNVSAFRQPAAVVLEFHPDLVLARRDTNVKLLHSRL
jgi:hypothetical protein